MYRMTVPASSSGYRSSTILLYPATTPPMSTEPEEEGVIVGVVVVVPSEAEGGGGWERVGPKPIIPGREREWHCVGKGGSMLVNWTRTWFQDGSG